MSASDPADEWDLTVPGDDAELAAEFRRHDVHPGQRVHVAVVRDERAQASNEPLPAFIGSFDGPTDLAQRSGEILCAEFPDGR